MWRHIQKPYYEVTIKCEFISLKRWQSHNFFCSILVGSNSSLGGLQRNDHDNSRWGSPPSTTTYNLFIMRLTPSVGGQLSPYTLYIIADKADKSKWWRCSFLLGFLSLHIDPEGLIHFEFIKHCLSLGIASLNIVEFITNRSISPDAIGPFDVLLFNWVVDSFICFNINGWVAWSKEYSSVILGMNPCICLMNGKRIFIGALKRRWGCA